MGRCATQIREGICVFYLNLCAEQAPVQLLVLYCDVCSPRWAAARRWGAHSVSARPHGQVKRMPFEDRVVLARLIVALADDDTPRAAAIMHEAGLRTARMSTEAAAALAVTYFDRCDSEVTEGLNLQEFLERVEARDPSSGFPEKLLMAARVSLLMRCA